MRLAVAVGVTLLLALLVFAFQASPASAQEESYTLNVSATGGGKVTGPGIDCGQGASDCSETYPVSYSRVCDFDEELGRVVCEDVPNYEDVTLTASAPAGWSFQGWGGDCSGTGGTCTLTMDANHSASASWADVAPPSVSVNNGAVTVQEGQTATNSGTYSDNSSGEVIITASRGTVTKTGTSSGTWSWQQTTDDGPSQNGPVSIMARDSSGNLSMTPFILTVNNVPPTATFNAPQTSYSGKSFVISINDPSDVSSADRSAGLTYAFDCGSGFFDSTTRFVSCHSGSEPTKTVRGQIRDKDGGTAEFTRTVTINPAPSSPPNGKIAFISFRDSGQEIYTMNNSDGSGLRRLTYTSAQEANVAYSPDGKKIAYDRDGEIYVMNANGTAQTNLTNSSTAGEALPAFSPDGSKITFQSRQSGSDDWEIYVMNADGTGEPQRLTDNAFADTDPSFSPNGSQIAFSSNRDGNDEIYVINADGSGPTNVTNNAAADLDPTYSAFNGNRIVFQTNRAGDNEELFGMFIGSGPTNLTNNPATDVQPAYALSSFQVAFATTRDAGNWDIYKLDDFGGPNSPTTRLTDNPALDVDPSWGGLSDFNQPATPAITSGPLPSSFSNSTSATFTFTANSETSPAFECRVYPAGTTPVPEFGPCTGNGTHTVNGLGAGQHTFDVRAIDTSGNVSASPNSRTWTVDLTAPTITANGITPPDGTSGVLEGTNATVTFSEPINTSTLNSTTFTLTKQGGSQVSASYSFDNATNTATLNPTGTLDSQSLYTAVVKGGPAGFKDRAGNPLTSDRTWSFRTGDTRSPTVNLTAPLGATVGGANVRLAASASDNVQVDRVDFLVNGDVVASDSTPPYEGFWDSTEFAHGTTVQITARVFDTSSNQTTSGTRTVTVDHVPPAAPTIGGGPSDPTNLTTASWTFTSDAGATFLCRLDGTGDDPFSSCLSGRQFTVQSDGSHTFEVKARDAAGNESPVASYTWTVDRVAPDTSITEADNLTFSNNKPTFNFGGTDNLSAAANLQFAHKVVPDGQTPDSVDFGPYSASTSATLGGETGLSDGVYKIFVKSRDQAGNEDADPVQRSFTIDTTAPPIPAITGGPLEGSTSTSRSASFTFDSDGAHTFLCRIDNASFSECTSGVSFTGLTDGQHKFEVKAKDQSGNESAVAVRRWAVDATAPTIRSWTPTGTGIRPTAKPTVLFSEAMNEALLERSVAGKPTTFFLKKGTLKIAATVTYVDTATGQHKAVLTPTKPLSRGTTYTATVTTAARDVAGNALKVVKTWRFTVA